MQTFRYESELPASVDAVFEWHKQPDAFEKLNPPWQPVELVEKTGTIRDGDELKFRLRLGPIPLIWHARHHDYVEGQQFCDTQVSGPFAKWVHTHRFEPTAAGGCRMVDEVQYKLPMGGLGQWLQGKAIRKQLERMFEHRHAVLRREFGEGSGESGGRTDAS